MTEVVAEGSAPSVPVSEPITIAGPQSPLALLRAKRDTSLKGLYIDLAVPRWEEEIGRTQWVRYKPSNPALFAQTINRMEREFQQANANKPGSGDPEWTTRANADVLVKACIATFDLDIGEDPPAMLPTDITFPTFSSTDLSDALAEFRTARAGHPVIVKGAIATARALYWTDGDLMLAAGQLNEWSGQWSKKAGEDLKEI